MPISIEGEKIQTFSIVAGTKACNARCPFCVSKMTPEQGIDLKPEKINKKRFAKSYNYAVQGKAETAMITGKGEPVLFPEHISIYLNSMLGLAKKTGYKIPIKELQTNGITIAEGRVDDYLHLWRAANLYTIAVSIVHFDSEVNRQIYLPHKSAYIDLPKLIDKLHEADFSVRLAVVLFKEGIDDATKLKKLIEFSKDNNVEQLTIRPVSMPDKSKNKKASEWVRERTLEDGQLQSMVNYLNEHGTVVKEFPFGGTVYSIYDVKYQNVCLTNCLTKDKPGGKYLRQLIFYPNGRIATDWTEESEGLE